MSIFSFLARLFGSLKALFNNLPAELKQAISVGVEVTEALKKIIDSPVLDVLTAWIPGNLDDLIVAKLRQALPVILVKLKLADAANLNDPQIIITTALQAFKELDPDVQPGVLHQLSIMIAQVVADGQLTWSDGVYLLQWFYKNVYKPAA